jgi:hypothetical protein
VHFCLRLNALASGITHSKKQTALKIRAVRDIFSECAPFRRCLQIDIRLPTISTIMKVIFPLLAVLAALSLPLCAQEAAPAKPSGGVWSSVKSGWHAVADPTTSALKSTTQAITGIFTQSAKPKVPLLLDVVCTPNPVVPSKSQNLQVIVKLHNNGKKTQLLEFQTTQRADAVLRDATGKICARASGEKEFAADSAMVTINPGERLEYTLSLPTQGLVGGKSYTLEVGLTGQSGLSGSLPITVK